VANIPERPAELPDFESPPLNEVVLGVQFNPPKGYRQINAGDVWGLFRSEFSEVEDREPLDPVFETFGLPARRAPFRMVARPSHDRFWFVRPDGTELIQFQQDRLLHNWRKAGNKDTEYPRFEGMMTRFCDEIEKLEEYFRGLSPQTLLINQCEISYVNYIPFELGDEQRASDWLLFVNFGEHEPEDFSVSFREIIRDASGQPQGRLTCECKIAITQREERVIAVSLTARGAPANETKEAAFEFLAKGRGLIGSRFADLTTDAAHVEWRRIK